MWFVLFATFHYLPMQIHFAKQPHLPHWFYESVPAHQHSLASIFLFNAKSHLPEELNQSLQATGLQHLLAISAGQLFPIIQLAENTMQILYFYTILPLWRQTNNRHIPAMRYKTWITNCISGVSFVMAFALCGHFGWTGALVRVFILEILVKSPVFIRIIHNLNPGFPHYYTDIYAYVLLWIACLLWNYNPLQDYSFILSSIGVFTGKLLGVLQQNFRLNPILQVCLLTTAIQILLYPIFPIGSLSVVLVANVLGQVLVGFFVTPLSLVVIGTHIFIHNPWLGKAAVAAFLYSLTAFQYMVGELAKQSGQIPQPFFEIFSMGCLAYLQWVLFVLYSLYFIYTAIQAKQLLESIND
jgi:hypothetical protein